MRTLYETEPYHECPIRGVPHVNITRIMLCTECGRIWWVTPSQEWWRVLRWYQWRKRRLIKNG